jgi:hypothetical protein
MLETCLNFLRIFSVFNQQTLFHSIKLSEFFVDDELNLMNIEHDVMHENNNVLTIIS